MKMRSTANRNAFIFKKTYGCSIEVLLHQERAKYMQACLDLICAWVSDGAPKRKKLILAKYGEWESIIGGIIDWIAPEVRFLADHRKEARAVHTERGESIMFFRRLMTEFPRCRKNAIGVSEITAKVFPKFGEKSALRDYVPENLIGKDGSFAKRLGRWLKNASTRRWGNIELIPVQVKHEGVWKYQIGENLKTNSIHAEVSSIFEKEPDAAVISVPSSAILKSAAVGLERNEPCASCSNFVLDRAISGAAPTFVKWADRR